MKKFIYRSNRGISGVLLALALVASPIHPAWSDTETEEEPTDPELNKLQLQVEKAKAEAEIAKANREKLEASLPESETKGLEGKTELDKVVIEAYIQTYKALDTAAEKIAEDIGSGQSKTIIIRNSSDIAALIALKSTRSQIKSLDEQYTKALSTGPGPVGGGTGLLLSQTVGSALGSFAEIASFFKTDTKISGVDVVVPNAAAISSLTNKLQEKGFTVYNSELYPIALLDNQSDDVKSFLASIDKVGASYDVAKPILEAKAKVDAAKAKVSAAKVKVEAAQGKVDDATTRLAAAPTVGKPAIAEELQAYRKELNDANIALGVASVELNAAETTLTTALGGIPKSRIPALAALNSYVDKLLLSLNQVDAAGISNLSKLVSAIELSGALKKPNTLLLDVNVQKGGGNNKTTTKRLDFGPAKDYYSGGIVVNYTLIQPETLAGVTGGKILKSNNTWIYQQYQRPFDITPKSK
jgi:hypothetical protein